MKRKEQDMKKRILGTILTIGLIAAQAVTAFASGSRTADVTLPGDNANYYKVTEGSAETFSYLAEEHQDVLDAILSVNKGEADLQLIAEQAPDLADELSGKTMVTPFFDLTPVNGGVLTADGKYLVTIEVPALSTAMTEVKLLHYSTERSIWEIVDPTNVDYESKQITAEFEDLSPVAVIAKVDASADTSVGTSPQTGQSSAWILWIAAAAVLVLAGAAVYRKGKMK